MFVSGVDQRNSASDNSILTASSVPATGGQIFTSMNVDYHRIVYNGSCSLYVEHSVM